MQLQRPGWLQELNKCEFVPKSFWCWGDSWVKTTWQSWKKEFTSNKDIPFTALWDFTLCVDYNERENLILNKKRSRSKTSVAARPLSCLSLDKTHLCIHKFIIQKDTQSTGLTVSSLQMEWSWVLNITAVKVRKRRLSMQRKIISIIVTGGEKSLHSGQRHRVTLSRAG